MSGPERNISVVKGKENNEKKTYQHISRARTGTAGTLLLLPPLLPLLLAAIAAVDVDAAVAVVVVVAVLPLLLPLLQLMGVVVVVVVERYVELAVTSGEEINLFAWAIAAAWQERVLIHFFSGSKSQPLHSPKTSIEAVDFI